MDAATEVERFERMFGPIDQDEGPGTGAAAVASDDVVDATPADGDPAAEVVDDLAGDPPANDDATNELPASEDDPAAAPAAEPEPAPLDSHAKAIIRAARMSEQRVKDELAEARAEVARLKQYEPAAPKPYAIDEVVLQQLEDMDPEAAKLLREAAAARATAAAAPAAPAAAPFVPQAFNAEFQIQIDQVPHLTKWQNDPDQTNWEAVKTHDAVLMLNPAWKDKSNVERLSEAVRRRSLEITPQNPARPTAADAKAVIDAKAKTPTLAVGDLRGRAQPTTQNDPTQRWARMSDAEIIRDNTA